MLAFFQGIFFCWINEIFLIDISIENCIIGYKNSEKSKGAILPKWN